MRVLVIGAGGKLGSHLLPALLSYHHQPIAFIRNKNKFESLVPASVLSQTKVIVGDAESSADIKRVLVDEKIDLFINCAGSPSKRDGSGPRSNQGDIGLAVLNAAKEIHAEKGKALRGYFVTGVALLVEPGTGGQIWHKRIPTFRPEHRPATDAIMSTPTDEVAWTILCPSIMVPRSNILEPYPTPRQGRRIVAFSREYAPVPASIILLAKFFCFFGNFIKPFNLVGLLFVVVWTRIHMDDYADRIVEEIGRGGDKYLGKRIGSVTRWGDGPDEVA